jgi:hypothetical protein
MQPWISSPVNTVAIYSPKAARSDTGSSILMTSAAIRNIMPTGEYLQLTKVCESRNQTVKASIIINGLTRQQQ